MPSSIFLKILFLSGWTTTCFVVHLNLNFITEEFVKNLLLLAFFFTNIVLACFSCLVKFRMFTFVGFVSLFLFRVIMAQSFAKAKYSLVSI